MTAAATTARAAPALPTTLEPGRLGAFRAVTDVAACLMPLLTALGWRGEPRQVIEALPHFADELDVTDLRNAMGRLGFDSRPLRTRLDRLDPRLLPCLFVPRRGGAVVVLERTDDGLRVYDGETAVERHLGWDDRTGVAYCFKSSATETGPASARGGWFRLMFTRFVPVIAPVAGMTLWLNILALATPLFVMAVYDRVVAAGSIDTLVVLLVGVGLALVCDLAIRTVRARTLAYVGARTERLVGGAAIERILGLPPHLTERAGVGPQIAKIKEFDRLREAFSGHLALTLLELPFLVVFLAAIGILGGVLVVVPVLGLAAYVAAAAVIVPCTRRAVARATAAAARRQAFLIEALNAAEPIRRLGAESQWIDRFRDRSASAAMATYRAGLWAAASQALTHGIMTAIGLAILVVGAVRVIDGVLSVGALVAIMALTWRTLAPLQAGLGIVGKIAQLGASITNVDRLMALRPERADVEADGHRRRFAGRVTVARVSHRHGPESDPALIGADLDIQPGEVVCVVGPSGAGKSTLLRLIAGLVVPQAGAVLIDGINLRQIDPVQLRQSIAYLPQRIDLFHGTIAQNLRLAEPAASDADLVAAAADAGVIDDILALPERFDTRLNGETMHRLPGGFAQRLGLARAYLRQADIVLLDEPANDLDAAGDRALIAAIEAMRGRTTVIIVTHRPSHMRVADRVALLERGQVRAFDRPEVILPLLSAPTS